MQHLEVSDAVRNIYGSLGVKRLIIAEALSSRAVPCWRRCHRNYVVCRNDEPFT